MYVILSNPFRDLLYSQLRFVGTIHWSVSKSTPDPEVVRKNIAASRERAAAFPLFLPRGVTSRNMKKFWNKLQFNPVAPVEVPFKAELFCSPPRSVERLRLLARQGRRRLKYSMRKQNGRPKRVVGIPNDAQEVAPLLALAHRPGLVQTVSRSNLDAVDDTTTTNSSTERKRRVRSSTKRLAEVFEGQDQTTQKINVQTAAPTISHLSRTTQVHPIPNAKPIAQPWRRQPHLREKTSPFEGNAIGGQR